jgi:hypothetical protein
MSNYIDLILVGPEQALPILIALILWLGLAGLGGLFTAKDRIIEANTIYGWAIVSGVLTAIGTIFDQSLFTLSCVLSLLALVGIYRSIKIGQPLFIKGMWRVLILALPLLWIAGAMEPSQWDEFSHWLPASKYLIEFNDFPTKIRPFFGPHMLPAYPFGWPYLIYLSSLIAGQFINNVSSTLNIFLLLSFSTFALRTAFRVAGEKVSNNISWPFASVIVLFATIFNPTFVQKIILTAYSDLSTSVLTGFSVLIGYYFLKTLENRKSGFSWSSVWQLSLALSLLINIRQANLVLVAGVIVSLTILVLRDNEIQITRYLKHIFFCFLPIMVVYIAWRYHVAVEFNQMPGVEVSFKKFSAWNLTVIPEILESMGYVAFKKIGFFGPMLVACYFGAKGLIKFKTEFDKISILAASMFLCYVAFLFFTYVAAFPASSAATAVSFWRYSTHNGMVATAFITIGGLYFLKHRNILYQFPKLVEISAVVLVVILPLAFAHKIRFDLEPPKPHFTNVAKDMRTLIPKKGLVFVLDPMGTGESNKITYYYLNQLGTGYIAAFTNPTIANIQSRLDSLENKTYVVVHSLITGLPEVFGARLSDDKSYLFQKHQNSWLLVSDWKKPKNHKY